MRSCSISISLSKPPMASICFFSSSVRKLSVSRFSHSAGMSLRLFEVIISRPLNTWPNTTSKRSRYFSSFTRAAREK